MSQLQPSQSELDLSNDACTLRVPGFCFNTRGLEVTNPTFEQWQFAMHALGAMHRRIVKPFRLWVCLMVLEGDARWGEQYTQAVDESGLAYQTIANAMTTVKKYAVPKPTGGFDASAWHPALSFEHHVAVQHLEPPERENLLQRAENEDLTTDELREMVRKPPEKPTLVCPVCKTELYLESKTLRSKSNGQV